MPQPIAATNDFVVKFANVNGSGSASANGLFARSILRMGIPIASRNIFPSNIQGLPTWFEVRVSEAGHMGRRGGVDMMVAMNPQTWDRDVAEIEPGGYLFYDSTRPMPKSKFRDDITVIGCPLTEITNAAYSDPRQRQLFKNIVYLGALSALLDMDVEAVQQAIAAQFKGKEKLVPANFAALEKGRAWAQENLSCPIGLRLRRADAVGDRIFTDGNNAAAGAWCGLWRGHGLRLVSHHALHLAGGSLREALREAAQGPRHRGQALRHRAGGGRACLDRHGDRRGLERGAVLHRDLGTRHLADAGVRGVGVFR